jgi:hypothetical protein
MTTPILPENSPAWLVAMVTGEQTEPAADDSALRDVATSEAPPASTVVLLVRFREHTFQTRRVVHVVVLPLPAGDVESLTTVCDTPVWPGQADVVRRIEGMPCEVCLARLPLPNIGQPVTEDTIGDTHDD